MNEFRKIQDENKILGVTSFKQGNIFTLLSKYMGKKY